MNSLDRLISEQVQETIIVAQIVKREGGALSLAIVAVLNGHFAATILAFERFGRVDELDLAIDDEGHPVAQLVGHGHIVGGQEDRFTGGLLPPDDVFDQFGVDRVQAGGRLVEEDELRVMDQGPREIQPHLHPLGIAAHLLVRILPQVDHF